MSKGKLYQTDGSDEDEERPPSRSQIRRERKAVKAELETLAKDLAALSPKSLERLGLDAELEGAVRILGGMQRATGMARQRGSGRAAAHALSLQCRCRRACRPGPCEGGGHCRLAAACFGGHGKSWSPDRSGKARQEQGGLARCLIE